MSMAQYGSLLILSHDEREELTRWAQSRTLPVGDVFRARLILALADGLSYHEIENKLDTSSPTIARWRKRFEKHRVEGLNPRHKGGRPRTVTPPGGSSPHRAPHAATSARWQYPLELPQTGPS